MRNAFLGAIAALLVVACVAQAVATEDWQRTEVNWRVGDGRRITGIRFPKDRPASTAPKEATERKKGRSTKAVTSVTSDTIQIDSPPVAGFVPHIAVAVTDKWAGDDLDWVAVAENSIRGRHLTQSPETDFVIGLFDTGASTHIVSYAGARRTGIYDAGLVTPSLVELSGATNSVFGRVSYPLGLFMDGLSAINADALTLDESLMVGQSNVSVVVGGKPGVGEPDLPTVVGSPMSVYFVTAINNDRPITLVHEGTEYAAPDIEFFAHGEPGIPQYANRIPMNLIPAGGINVQYIIDYEAIFDFVFRPGTPSVIVGNSYQSLFFVDSVDLHNNARSSLDNDRFMFDTGAQITVIGSGVGSRLGLNPARPDFEVEIQDVTGSVTMIPGFFLDLLEIPALGDWLSFSNVPVIMLDVASPEGGYLEGIIGMNLFVEFNLVFHGGGLLGQSPPALEFERIKLPAVGDISPIGGDGMVDHMDLAALASAWLSSAGTPNWNPRADIGPKQLPDGLVNGADFAMFATYWRTSLASDPNEPTTK